VLNRGCGNAVAPISKLNSMTACDTAFGSWRFRYLGDLTANHEATCKGDPEALHQMRVVLTRLRTAVLFSPRWLSILNSRA